MINPMQGSTDPQPMDEKTRDGLESNSTIETSSGALAGYRKLGATLELQGKEDVEGSAAYKVKVTRKTGEPQYWYIDAASFLPLKMRTKVNQMGQDVEVESVPGNFKKVNGVLMSYTSDQRVGGRSMMNFTLETIEANTPLDDALFKMPAPKAAEKK
jgi:outer membrane lipoprotein-sorting protein